MSKDDLQKLRGAIRKVDAEILALAKKRVDLAERIGRWKLESGAPVRDFEMEHEVLEITAQRCEQIGLDPTLGREITRALISGAVKIQEDLHEHRRSGTQKRISILGGKGKMGGWFANYLSARGHRVTIYDPAGPARGFRNTRRFEKAVCDAEIVLLAVPLSGGAGVYRKVRRLRPEGAVIDMFSLKSPVLGEIKKAVNEGLSVSSIHPLFGPDVYLLSDRILLLAPCGHEGADRLVEGLFSGTSLETVRVPVAEHDKAMGVVLGLSHAVSIIFNEALVRAGIPAEKLRRVATTTYLKQSRTASEVAGENPRLYYDIQRLNEYSPQVYDRLEQALRTFRKAAQSGRPASFEGMMRRAREFYGEK